MHCKSDIWKNENLMEYSRIFWPNRLFLKIACPHRQALRTFPYNNFRHNTFLFKKWFEGGFCFAQNVNVWNLIFHFFNIENYSLVKGGPSSTEFSLKSRGQMQKCCLRSKILTHINFEGQKKIFIYIPFAWRANYSLSLSQ